MKRIILPLLFFPSLLFAVQLNSRADKDIILMSHMEEGAGSISRDAAAISSDGVISGDVTWTTAIPGRGLYNLTFGGVNGRLFYGDNPLFSVVNTSLTCLSDFKPMTTNKTAVFQKGGITGTDFEWDMFSESGKLKFQTFFLNGSGAIVNIEGDGTIVTGAWHRVGFSHGRDDGDAPWKTYLNGTIDKYGISSGGTGDSLTGLKIGTWHGGSALAIQDECVCYQRLLTDEEIKADYILFQNRMRRRQ